LDNYLIPPLKMVMMHVDPKLYTTCSPREWPPNGSTFNIKVEKLLDGHQVVSPLNI